VLRALPLSGHPGEQGIEADAALVAAAVHDAEAFAPLYERYMPRVYRYLAARVGSPETAADLTQTVMVKAWRSLASYQPERGAFASWLFQVARNAAADERRRSGNRATSELDETFVDGQLTPQADVELQDRQRRLRAAIATLDQERQELLALRYAAGLSTTDIAPLVGKSPEAVKKTIWRTIRYLRENYSEELA